ncbi:MAG TPA: LLM class flavin-dependent oxidoreductase [Thermoanaerobaculia bacterium]|nr:LLM class flavin-dependent oxidoreductase [Thermoanaerobaculia bacterium]
MPLRFHWSLSQAGDRWRKTRSPETQSGVPSLPAHIEFCRCAERNGIDSLLLAFSFARPDPVVLASALGVATGTITLMIACRPGVFAPAVFVQQINTLSALLGGRVSVNLVAGHSPHEHGYYGDFLAHDERYSRAGEFLDICAAFWRRDGEVEHHGRYYQVEKGRLGTPFVSARRSAPEIYLSGNSPQAEALAARHATCLLRYPDTPERLRDAARPLLDQGVEVGLRLAILGRATGDEARRDAAALLEQAANRSGTARRDFVRRTDSVAFRSTLDLAEQGGSPWLTSYLWTALVPYLGEVCLIGSAEEIAAGLQELAGAGISHFLLSGWPDEDEMEFFGREVLPRLP